jgi:hypothetical protein
MAHRAHHRDRGRGDGPRHRLLIERPEVFEGASTACHDQDVESREPVENLNAFGDLGRRQVSLYLGRIDEDLEVGKAPMEDAA